MPWVSHRVSGTTLYKTEVFSSEGVFPNYMLVAEKKRSQHLIIESSAAVSMTDSLGGH